MSPLTRRALLRASLIAGLAVAARRAGAAGTEPSGRWFCTNEDCDPYVYDPARGDPNAIDPDHPIQPNVDFRDLPATWVCPVCGAIKGQFRPCNGRDVSAACRQPEFSAKPQL